MRRPTLVPLLTLVAFALALPATALANGGSPVTTTRITTPAAAAVYPQDDGDALLHPTMTVTGTADGSPGQVLELRCYAGTDSDVFNTTDPIVVGADHTFSAEFVPGDYVYGTCRLRAVPVPEPSPGALSQFTGPLLGIGFVMDSPAIVGGPNDGVSTGWLRTASQVRGQMFWVDAGACGLALSSLYPSIFPPGVTGLFHCNGALHERDGTGLRSQIRADGTDLYLPGGAEEMNPDGVGLPSTTVSYDHDAVTGNLTIHESAPTVSCTPTLACSDFASGPVRLEREIVQDHDGLVGTVTDRWTSVDGQAHQLDLRYDQAFLPGVGITAFSFPGHAGHTVYGAGDVLTGFAKAPDAIYVHDGLFGDNSVLSQERAIRFSSAPDDVTFTSFAPRFEMHYARTVPATGALVLTMTYEQGASAAEVRGLEDAGEAPVIAITGPSNGTTVTTPSVVVTGTAADNIGVRSLTVNGTPTSLNGDGRWSQTVPLAQGANTIKAIATDASGLASQVQITVTYSLPPVAATPATCRVPYLGGRTLAQARVRLPAAHCAVGRVTSRWAGRQNAHRVVGQAVHGGTLLSAGTKVALVQGTKKRPPRRHRPPALGHAKKRGATARGHARKRAASRTGRSR